MVQCGMLSSNCLTYVPGPIAWSILLCFVWVAVWGCACVCVVWVRLCVCCVLLCVWVRLCVLWVRLCVLLWVLSEVCVYSILNGTFWAYLI